MAPRSLGTGKVEVSDATGSWTAELPDELLLTIFALTEDAKNCRNIALVCRRWNRLVKDGEFLPIFYPIFSGLSKGLLSQQRLYSNLNASIKALDCGNVERRQIGSAAGFVSQWTYVATKDHLLIAIAGTHGVGVWNEKGEALVEVPGAGYSVQFVDYENAKCLLCVIDDRIELRPLDSGEAIRAIDAARANWSRVLYLSIGDEPYIAWNGASLRLCNVRTQELINTNVMVTCEQVISSGGSTYLIGWGEGQSGYTYLRLGEEQYQPIAIPELGGWRNNVNSRILEQIEYDEIVYSPVWSGPSQNEVATLRLVSFGDAITASQPFQLSTSQPVLQARIEEIWGVQYLLASTDSTVIKWEWDKPNAPIEKPRLKPHYDAVNQKTDLNGWGAFAVDVWQGGKRIKTHHQLPSGEFFGGELSPSLLYVEAGVRGRRALWLQEDELLCYDPSTPISGELNNLQQYVEARQIVFQERSLFLVWNRNSESISLFEPNLANEGEQRVEHDQRAQSKSFWERHGRRIKMTAAGSLGALYLGWMVQQSIGRAQIGNLWRSYR